MKQKLMNSIGGCLLLAFLLLACPIRGQAADAITVTDNDNGVEVEYTLTAMESDSAEQEYSAEVSFADADAQPAELNVKSVVEQDGTSYKVKDIESIAYKDSITSVKIEEGITSMNGGALERGFADSDTVTISFPDTLEDVRDSFLNWKDYPDSISVPKWLSKMQPENGVIYAGKVAIYVPPVATGEAGTAKAPEITFKDGCTKIAHKVLLGNTDVTKVNIPASVKAIGGAAFAGCTNLSQVNFAANAQLEDLDWRAFYDCTALTSIRIPDSVTRIGNDTFSGCTSLAIIDISTRSKLATIEYGAFGYYPCKGLDINSIWENKYVDDSYRSKLLWPNSTSGIRDNAGVPVKKIYIPAAVVRVNPDRSATGLFGQSTTLEEVTIGSSEGVKVELPFEMFAQCTNLKKVNFNGNVDNIGVAAFIGCENLKSINLDGVESVDTYAFAKTGLKEVTIPQSVSNVGAIAFGGCTDLETMTIESSLSGQNRYASKLLDILGNIDYSEYNLHEASAQAFTPIRSNADFRKMYPNQTALRVLNIKMDDNGKNVLEGRQTFAAHLPSLEKATLPEGIKEIPPDTFLQCFSLKEVDMPKSVQTIGSRAFGFDVGLDIDFTKLTNLTSIEAEAFSIIGANGENSPREYTDEITDNGGIKNIILPESVKTIGNSAFFGQRNVKKIVIPKSVTSIQGAAFQMIPALEELEIYASLDIVSDSSFNSIFWSDTRNPKSKIKGKLKKITLGENYSATGKIGSALFCKLDFDEIDIQMNNIQNLGNSMFMENKRLKSFTVPKTVKVIDQAAFYETTALKEITIPANVKTMDIEVFRKSGVEKVWILNKDLTIKEPTKDDVSEEESATKTKVSLYTNETVDDYIAIPKNIAIYGYAGSTAEAYAEAHGNKFIAINKVTFDSVGGSKVDYKEVATGEKVPVPEPPTKEHYVFKGWYTDKDYKTPFDFDKEIKTGDITLYAKWEKEKHTVSFDTNGGSTVDAQQIAYEEKATEPAAPKKEHYVFDGWYKEPECKNKYTFETELVTTNITLYAGWEKEVYTVSFDSAGGSAVDAQKVTYEDKAAKPEAPTKEHYVFAGWYKEPECETEYTFEEKVEANITLYAKWKEEVYTVSFDSAGGSAVAAQQVEYEEKATKPDNPTKEHYVFAGWYKEPECETEYTFEEKVEANITLYAKWDKAVYTVSFNSAGGSEVADQQVTYENKAAKPTDPTRANYVFEGWYTDKECTTAFDFDNNLIEEDITLYAKWTKKEIPTTADKPQTFPVQPVKKNTVISNGKNTYKVTKVTKQKTGTVEFTGIVKGKKASVVTIPNTITINGKKFKVTSIATGAFANNKVIKKVIIGNNVKVIKKRAFYNAKNLRKIVIGANVTTIQKQAFGKLPKLEKIIVKSKKLKKVHKKAFSPLKRELVIRIYKKPVATKNNKKKATNKNTAIINRKITIKVPKSKIVKYTKLFKACKR